MGGAGHNLAKLSQDSSLAVGKQRRWGQWRQREFQPQPRSVIFTLNSHNMTSLDAEIFVSISKSMDGVMC